MARIFETSFDIPEWHQDNGLSDAQLAPDGDGIKGDANNKTTNGSGDQITPAANNPSGGGGRGYRHWVGDGENNLGGSIRVDLDVGPRRRSELWLRYYIRFQLGFAWGSPIEMKTIYVNRLQPGTFYFGLKDGVIGAHVEIEAGNRYSSVTWAQMQGGSTGDGLFHCLEIHVKMNPIGGQSTGIMEFWLDGTLIFSASDVKFSNSSDSTFGEFAFGENHNNPQNGGVDVYVDFDDIVMDDAAYIGPLSGGTTRIGSFGGIA